LDFVYFFNVDWLIIKGGWT